MGGNATLYLDLTRGQRMVSRLGGLRCGFGFLDLGRPK